MPSAGELDELIVAADKETSCAQSKSCGVLKDSQRTNRAEAKKRIGEIVESLAGKTMEAKDAGN